MSDLTWRLAVLFHSEAAFTPICRLEQVRVFREDFFKFLVDPYPDLMFNSNIEIDRDRFAGHRHLYGWRACCQQICGDESHTVEKFHCTLLPGVLGIVSSGTDECQLKQDTHTSLNDLFRRFIC